MADLEPEQAVLGAALLGARGHEGLLALDADDFQQPRHRVIAVALQRMIRRGENPDAITLAGELDQEGNLASGRHMGGVSYLLDLSAACPVPDNGWYYACQVRDAARLLAMEALGARLSAAAKHRDADTTDEVIARHADGLSKIPPPLDHDPGDVPTLAELLDKKFEHRWLVPGLLARRERIVITAGEGQGKSVALSQWAAALAAGLHPWTGLRLERSYRVLLIDAENDEEQTQHRFRWIGERIDALNGEPGWAKRISQQIKPEGLDIVGKDRAWFMRTVGRVSPDFVVIGPAYKIMGAAKTSDDASILALFAVLDEMRVKFDAGLMIEAHSGHATDEEGRRSVRPFGSSVWMRWPEVGFGMRRNKDLDVGQSHAEYVDVVHFRGSRGNRDWPEQLRYGKPWQLPWTPGFNGTEVRVPPSWWDGDRS